MMRMRMLGGLMVLLVPALARAQSAPQVDQAEILRLGNLVQQVGTGPRSDGLDQFLAAMAPPASDADKWFISLLSSKGCAPCLQLKQAFGTDPALKALADPGDPARSWSHFNVYEAEDQSQAFRFSRLQIEAFPTVLVQPPRSQKYGDPSTVVFQGTYSGDPRQLAADITAAIRRYIAKVIPPAASAMAPPAPAGVRSEPAAFDPPWQPVPKDPLPSLLRPFSPVRIPPLVQPSSDLIWSWVRSLLWTAFKAVLFPLALVIVGCWLLKKLISVPAQALEQLVERIVLQRRPPGGNPPGSPPAA